MHNRLSRVNTACFKINTVKHDCTFAPLIKLRAGGQLFRNFSCHAHSIFSCRHGWRGEACCVDVCETVENSFSLTTVELSFWFHLNVVESTIKSVCVVRSH